MLLKEQFPELLGLQLTLLLKKQQPRFQKDKLYIQIIFDKEEHQFVTSTIFTKGDQVRVHDSVYTSIEKDTKAVISDLYGPTVSPCLINIGKQKGGADCGCDCHNLSTRA